MQIDPPVQFAALCQKHGVKPDAVIQQFMRDLCGLEGSSGSDERLLAQLYYDRCGYSFKSTVPERLDAVADTMAEWAGVSRLSGQVAFKEEGI